MIPLLQPSIDGLRAYLLEKNCFISWPEPIVQKIVIEYITSGKLIRGGLLVHLLEKKNSNDALILGSALELAQSGLVIQDDIMDHDELRRGKPSLHVQLTGTGSKETGTSLALCISDYLFFASQELLSSIKHTSFIPELNDYWNTQLKRVCIGQYADNDYASKPVIPASTMLRELYANKTSSYTFCIPILTHSILEAMPQQTKILLEKMSNDLGVLFQLTDDMLNVYGDSTISGKPTGSDIREKKKTLLVSLVYEALDKDDRKTLKDYYGNTNLGDISSIITLMSSIRVKQKIDDEVQSLKDSIEQSLADPSVSSNIKITVKSLLDFIVTRTV